MGALRTCAELLRPVKVQEGMARRKADAEYASVEEVRRAIDGLSDADYLRLHRHARILLGGTPYSCADDLVFDVLSVAFEAACGGRGRRWTRDVKFMTYLHMTIRGVASDSRRTAQRRREVRDDPGRDTIDSPHLCIPSAEDRSSEEDQRRRENREDECVERVTTYFKNDPEVIWVIKGITEGVPASEICKQARMSKRAYDSAHRRFRRGLDWLFPGRRKKHDDQDDG
jgi:DNA-directed RNA polymerase specialized sigma24 family protein